MTRLAELAGEYASRVFESVSPLDAVEVFSHSGTRASAGTVSGVICRIIDRYGHNFEKRMGYAAATDPARSGGWGNGYGDGNVSYLSGFAIPGVGAPPVRAFVVVMLLFSVVVGPVNYILLFRRKRQHWMVVTVPAAALLAVLAVVFYAFLFEGLGIKGRVATVSWLDADRGRAVTLTRQALYAGFSPGTVRFEPHTAVFPISPGQRRSRQADWTGGQELTGDWVPSRTQVQWVAQSVEPARQRIEVAVRDDGRPMLSNGLGVRIDSVYLQMPDGQTWQAGSVPDGGQAVLTPHAGKPPGLTGSATVSELALAGRIELAPGRFVAMTDGPLFERGGPPNVRQLRSTHMIAGTFRLVE